MIPAMDHHASTPGFLPASAKRPWLVLWLLFVGAGLGLEAGDAQEPEAGPPARVAHGVEVLRAALKESGLAVGAVEHRDDGGAAGPQLGFDAGDPVRRIEVVATGNSNRAEGFSIEILAAGADGDDGPARIRVSGMGPTGALYGCLELADRVRGRGGLPAVLELEEAPAFKLRGACIGLQLTSKLPGRETYEYPYTPENFPWFYDKQAWIDYLDLLAEHRFNTLYLWNGHPFASLLKLDDYPEALEVPEETLARNVEMFRFLTHEADRRGIWVIQMFYNIFVSAPFAEHHGIATQHRAATPLIADYNRKSIAGFVEQYPNVGLLVCLGEALQGQDNQEAWMSEVVIPGVRDGMEALGLEEEPPIVVRAHSVGDVPAMMASARRHYSNLFTMAKYNGESLTTWQPRGEWRGIHNEMGRLGSAHVVNVHLLSNLEPFRYGAQDFIRRSTLAMRDELGAEGVHLYPLAYWDWPNSPDRTDPLLKQYRRDWIWFEAWGRYAWDPGRDPAAEKSYWTRRLAERFGNREAAARILEALNQAGVCAPKLLRRFGITEGNRQTLSLGMTLDQLVRPEAYGVYAGLWESHSPPGERIDVFVERELAGQPHEGETPVSVIEDVLARSGRAVAMIDAAAPMVRKNEEEFDRLRNDLHCIRAMCEHYAAKVRAAIEVKRHEHDGDLAHLRAALGHLEASVEAYRKLEERTREAYRYANTLQIGHRRIPFRGEFDGQPAYYHWSQVLPEFEKELASFRERVGREEILAAGGSLPEEQRRLAALPYRADGTYRLEVGARPFGKDGPAITALAPELEGLTGVRSGEEAFHEDGGRVVDFEASQPAKVLVGFFDAADAADAPRFARPPNPDIDSRSADHGGVEVTLRHALTIDGLPPVNVHVFEFEPGPRRFDPRGEGLYLFLGLVPGEATIEPRDVGLRE